MTTTSENATPMAWGEGRHDREEGAACFAHGLAHLLDRYGVEDGLVRAARTILMLHERPDLIGDDHDAS